MITRRQTVLLTLVTTMALAGACANAGCGGSSSTDSNAGAGQGAGATLPDSGIALRPNTGFGISPQGGTITGATTGGGLVVTTGKLGMLASCSSGQTLTWNGSAWVCGAGGITNAAGANVIPKSDGTNLVASSLSDSGSLVTLTEPFQVQDFRGTTVATTATGTQNDWAPTGNSTATTIVNTAASTLTINSLVGGANGRRIRIINNGTGDVVINNNGAGTASNRFANFGTFNLTLYGAVYGATSCTADFEYLSVDSFWHETAFNCSTVPFLATASGATIQSNGNLTGVVTLQASTATISGLSTLTGGFTSAAASTMTAPLTVQQLVETVVSPSLFTTQQNDFAGCGATATICRLSCTAGACDVTGITNGVAGRVLTLENVGASTIFFYHANVGSTAANRFITSSGSVTIIVPNGTTTIRYDGTQSRWMFDKQASGTFWQGDLNVNNGAFSVSGTSTLQAVNATNIAASGFVDATNGLYAGNGVTADLSYLFGANLGFKYNTNAAALGQINAVGYLGGTTQFREAEILDGKGGAIAAFANASDVAMPNDAHQFTNTGYLNKFDLSVLGNTTLGDSGSDVITFSNGPIGINRYDGKHLEWAEEWLIGSGPNTNASPYDNYVLQFSGTGTGTAAVTGVSGHPGVMALTTGVATVGGYATMTTDPNTVYFGDGNWTYEWRGGWPTLSSSSNSVASEYITEIGFTDSPTTPNVVDGCYFAYDKGNALTGGVNGTNLDRLECWCASNSTRTGYLMNGTGNSDESFALGTATVAAMTYPNTNNLGLKIVVTGTTRAEFYVDSGAGLTKRCDINTNLPSTTSRLTGFGIGQFPEASTGTGARTVNTDYTRAQLDFTTARSQ